MGLHMTVVVYYILEAVKFLMIYLLGMSMRASADWRRRLAAGCLVLLTGILMNFLRLSPAYPVLYLFFALLLFYLLIEQAAFRNVVIVFWALGVIFSVDTISYVLVSNHWHYKNEKLKEQYLEMQTEHYRYLEERNLDTKKFRHDLRGHILVVKECIREEKWDEL